MVKFIHISDAHLGFEQYGIYQRFKDFGRAFKLAIELGVKEHVDFFIISGDFFNKRSINASTLLQADDILLTARDAGIPVFVCEGNHDSVSYGDNWSWLGYLSRKGQIILLRPEDKTGYLIPWNSVTKEGSYVEHEFRGEWVRIFGFGYPGAATKNEIMRYADDIIHDDALNIGMLHYGVEGIIANMHGTITESALRPLRKKIDYLALGHIHKYFTIENWVFNPGSLENWSLDETNYSHGLYMVEMKRDENGVVHIRANFVDGKEWRRPFLVWNVDLTGIHSPAQVMQRVKEFLIRGGYIANTDNLPGKDHEQSSEQKNPRISPVSSGLATLDSYFKENKYPEVREIENPKDKEKIYPKDKKEINPKDNEKNETGEEGGCLFSNIEEEPLVILRLKGVISIKEKIDVDPIKEFLERTLRPCPLYLEVRDESSGEGYMVEDTEVSSKAELERQVIMELLMQGEFSSHAKELHTLIKDIKEVIVNKERGGLDDFGDRIRNISRERLSITWEGTSPCTQEGEEEERPVDQSDNEIFTHS